MSFFLLTFWDGGSIVYAEIEH